jgi:predicted outer membrane lipoprotein
MINRAALCGVLVAGTVSVLAYELPYKLGLLLAVLVGMVTAMVIEETMDKIKARRG